MRTYVLAGLGASVVLAACAPSTRTADRDAPPRARQCFSVQQVQNFRQGDPSQVFIRVGRADVYELNAAGGCMDLDFANRLALIPDGAGLSGSRLCTDDWARVVVPGSTSTHSVCRVRISRKLTAEEVAALPGAHRP